MPRVAACLWIALAAAAVASCGSYVPLPVPATPTAVAVSSPAPQREPPPSSVIVESVESGGTCSHSDAGNIARFHGHYNASDGNHYHGWEPPLAKAFWVVC
jgi:hypothetical protein